MSMRLNLAKIEAALLESVRTDPALIGTILVNVGQPHAGFSRETDMFADDYRTLIAIAEGRAEAEHGTTQWRRCYPWLATATGENGANDMQGYEFGYGPAFALDPAQVTAVAQGLAGEGWGSGAVRGDGVYEGFEALVPFYAAAAREGKSVVGGVT
ncbi:hypothetical protein ACIBO5_51090 [Nonomuraea angiospora]|uniref:hypothetical protein n=1 Tax=Nonomuraea angiospora TaxID=46172 RepID=UPI00379D99AC